MTRKFECIKSWPRQRVGDVVMEWEWKKFPTDIQQKCFKEIVAKVETKKPAAVVETKKETVQPTTEFVSQKSNYKKD